MRFTLLSLFVFSYAHANAKLPSEPVRLQPMAGNCSSFLLSGALETLEVEGQVAEVYESLTEETSASANFYVMPDRDGLLAYDRSRNAQERLMYLGRGERLAAVYTFPASDEFLILTQQEGGFGFTRTVFTRLHVVRRGEVKEVFDLGTSASKKAPRLVRTKAGELVLSVSGYRYLIK